MINKKKLKTMLYVFVLVISCFLLCLSSSTIPAVYALSLSTNNEYSNVMDDLQLDESFDVEKYPAIDTNYTIDVIQVAESSSKQLFVYTYQPSADTKNITATSISISTGINNNLHPFTYTLTLLNKYGVFYKYKVDDFTMLNDQVRYYEIPEIFRAYNKDIDGSTNNGQTISEKAIKVAKRFTACTVNGDVSYGCIEIDTIVVENQFCGTTRYDSGFYIVVNEHCDSHYVAFSTDIDMDRLIQVEMEYKQVHYKQWQLDFITPDFIFGDGFGDIDLNREYDTPKELVKPTHLIIDEKDVGDNSANIFVQKYSWKRIQKINDFLQEVPEEHKSKFDGMEWILRFAETTYTDNSHMIFEYHDGYEVFDVTLLRFYFEKDGQFYNLGVVADKQTGTNEPLWEITDTGGLLKTLLAVVLLILLVVVLTPLLPVIFSLIFSIIKIIFKILIWIISAPFKLIRVIFKK